MAEIVYFDSCIFIELLERQKPARLEACEELLKKAQQKTIVIAASALAITEVNQIKGSTDDRATQSRKITAFFENEYIAIRAVTREIAEYAHDLTRLHGLFPMDAIHAATAALSRATVLYTYDGTSKRRKGLLDYDGKIGTPPLRIQAPPDPDAGTLWERTRVVSLQDDGSVSGNGAKSGILLKGTVSASAPKIEIPVEVPQDPASSSN